MPTRSRPFFVAVGSLWLEMAVALVVPSASARAQWKVDGSPVCAAPAEQQSANAVSDGQGGVIIVWQDIRGSSHRIYAQRIDALGFAKWDMNGVGIAGANGDQFAPVLTSDNAGGAVIAWYDDRDTAFRVYAQRINSSGQLQWAPGGVALALSGGGQYDPVMAADTSGVVIAWKDLRNGTFDVYAQRMGWAGDAQWLAGGVPVCAALGHQMAPIIALDGSGGGVIAWTDLRTSGADIYAQRLGAGGNIASGWPVDGKAVCLAPGDQESPRVSINSDGEAYLAWADPRTGSFDIYAALVTADGNLAAGWQADGNVVSAAPSTQVAPVMVTDGADGAFIAWQDSRSDFADVYIQRMLRTGGVAPGWPPNGIGAAIAANSQYGPVLIADGVGGSLIAWLDDRDSHGLNIYCLRVNSSGGIHNGWVQNGTLVCGASGDQVGLVISSDEAAGAIMAWADFRGGASWDDVDIYSQRITGTGVLGPNIVELPSNFSLMPAYPNPTRGEAACRLDLPVERRVWFNVFDVAGRNLRRVRRGEPLSAGSHVLQWDGLDEDGRRVRSGIYLLRVQAGNDAATRSVVLRR